jgi:hypothetical protein
LPPNEQVVVGYCVTSSATQGILSVNISNAFVPSAILSAGMTSVPSMSYSGSGNQFWINIHTGSVNLFNTTNGNDKLQNYFLQSQSLALPNTGSPYYIVAQYNNGSPNYNVLTSNSTIDQTQVVNVNTVVRPIYGGVEYINWDLPGYALSNKLQKRFVRTQRYARESGLDLSESGSAGGFVVTTGVIWYGATYSTVPPSNSGTTTTRLFMHNAASSTGWSSSLVTVSNNTQYDNVSTGLTALGGGGNHWTVNFIYSSAAGDSDTYIVLGNTDYTTLVSAQASQPPANLPTVLNPIGGTAVLVGRIINQKSVRPAIQVDSSWVTLFTPSTTSDHSSLTNLFGGAAPNDYYHLTAAQSSSINQTASYILPGNIGNSYSSSVSTQIGTKQNTLTNTLYTITASLATSASYAPGGSGTTLTTGSTYPITSSWAVTASFSNNSLSASYLSASVIGSGIYNIVVITQSDYNLLSPPVATTLYIING